MTTQDLYDFAAQKCIDVMKIDCTQSGSVSLMTDTGYYVGLDINANGIQEKVMLAHEIGHCQTGAFYNRYSKLNIISKLEYKADKWAIKKLLPEDELERALAKGYTEVWQLAEYFEISEELIRKAFWVYYDKIV